MPTNEDKLSAGDSSLPSALTIERAVNHLGFVFGITIDQLNLVNPEQGTSQWDGVSELILAAERAGIAVREIDERSAAQLAELTRQGYAALIFQPGQGSLSVLGKGEIGSVDCYLIGSDEGTPERSQISQGAIERQLADDTVVFVAKKELECESLSDHHSDGQHQTPLKRFVALLSLDRRDISLVILFAGVAGLLGLASPLVVESLVNVVSWGTYFQPLLVLASMLLIFLGMAGVLKVLQTWVVEIIQRRQFVRIVSDLAHRFPRANQDDLVGEYPRELANRVFDIMTIQKASAVLLLDGVSIILTTVMGLVLLAFYHPFLLGFDIVLVITMISLTWALGRGGILTAIEESKTKYKVAHWLQDVISMPQAFKSGGGEALAVRRANQLTAGYVRARRRQFAVVIRQVIFAVGLQVVASTTVLGLGGWLVLSGELTLGQLVASELVVTVVVSAFAKAGKSLEKFYDLMAGIDKVGHLLDIRTDSRADLGEVKTQAGEVAWGKLTFAFATSKSSVPAGKIPAGSSVALTGDDVDCKAALAKAIAGLIQPVGGLVQVAGVESIRAAMSGSCEVVGYVGEPQIFYGTLQENIDLGRRNVPATRVREIADQVGLSDLLLWLPLGMQEKLQTGGYPLSGQQKILLMFARAMLMEPSVLVIDGVLDSLSEVALEKLWAMLANDQAPWTLIVATNRADIAERCDIQFGVYGNE